MKAPELFGCPLAHIPLYDGNTAMGVAYVMLMTLSSSNDYVDVVTSNNFENCLTVRFHVTMKAPDLFVGEVCPLAHGLLYDGSTGSGRGLLYGDESVKFYLLIVPAQEREGLKY